MLKSHACNDANSKLFTDLLFVALPTISLSGNNQINFQLGNCMLCCKALGVSLHCHALMLLRAVALIASWLPIIYIGFQPFQDHYPMTQLCHLLMLLLPPLLPLAATCCHCKLNVAIPTSPQLSVVCWSHKHAMIPTASFLWTWLFVAFATISLICNSQINFQLGNCMLCHKALRVIFRAIALIASWLPILYSFLLASSLSTTITPSTAAISLCRLLILLLLLPLLTLAVTTSWLLLSSALFSMLKSQACNDANSSFLLTYCLLCSPQSL